VGFDVNAAPIKTQLHDGLREVGRKWALHVLEGPYSWCLSAAYILATVISGCPLFLSLAEVVIRAAANDPDALLPDRLKYSMLALDSVFYCFLPLCFSMLLRVIQGRELLARLGKRTLVIADVPYVHQLLESYVSKLFSQSYSIASIDVHGANGVDHLVHRFTHRVYRGTLIAVGRTDGRLFSQSKGESWILMAMQQCKAIMHLGAGPEIVSVGHNPFTNTDVLKNHVVIDNRRPRFLCEALTDIQSLKTTEPMSVSAAIKELDRTTSSLDDTVKCFSTSTWHNPALQKKGSDVIVGHHHLQSLAPDQVKQMQERLSVLLEQNAERSGEEMLYEEMSRHGGHQKKRAEPTFRAGVCSGSR